MVLGGGHERGGGTGRGTEVAEREAAGRLVPAEPIGRGNQPPGKQAAAVREQHHTGRVRRNRQRPFPMATTIEAVAVASSRWPTRRSARKLADDAIRTSVARAGVTTNDIDLLLNAGLYRERILGEPALAALIQTDVGANPEDPHDGRHGTFSFDVANGTCGPLTALQIADGFLRAGTVQHALIVASDADPGRGLAPRFPFAASGAAVGCRWDDDGGGLVGFRWETSPG